MEQLKTMKQTLMAAAQAQMGDLTNVDAKELGEVIDMIKDLEEAMYYCTIVKAMEEKDKEQTHNTYYYTEYKEPPYWYNYDRDMDMEYNKMYYGGNRGGSGNGSSSGSSSGGNNMGGNSSRSYYSERDYRMPMEMRDRREGRSPIMRKMYMESKEMHREKAAQIKDLENYMSELTQDITEMIEGASPEEKQLLQKKIATLASKI